MSKLLPDEPRGLIVSSPAPAQAVEGPLEPPPLTAPTQSGLRERIAAGIRNYITSIESEYSSHQTVLHRVYDDADSIADYILDSKPARGSMQGDMGPMHPDYDASKESDPT